MFIMGGIFTATLDSFFSRQVRGDLTAREATAEESRDSIVRRNLGTRREPG
jgi:hypothetical protein